VQACETETCVDLFAALAGTPQAGGSWQDLDGSGSLTAGCFDATGVADGTTWHFQYNLAASSTCPKDSAIVTVDVINGPNAGQDASPPYCSSQPPQPLGVPVGGDPGGTWYDPSFNASTGIFDPGSDPPGTYTYVIEAVGNCPGDSAEFNISVTDSSNAGSSGSLAFCSNSAPEALINGLGGTPDLNGTWNDKRWHLHAVAGEPGRVHLHRAGPVPLPERHRDGDRDRVAGGQCRQ
jgi:hypothetical protein